MMVCDADAVTYARCVRLPPTAVGDTWSSLHGAHQLKQRMQRSLLKAIDHLRAPGEQHTRHYTQTHNNSERPQKTFQSALCAELTMTIMWLEPQAMCLTRMPRKSSDLTIVGVVRFCVSPCPSCPLAFLPHVYSLPGPW